MERGEGTANFSGEAVMNYYWMQLRGWGWAQIGGEGEDGVISVALASLCVVRVWQELHVVP